MAGLDCPMQTKTLNLFWHKAELRLVEQPEPEAPLFAISRPTLFGGREEFLLQYPARLEPPTKRDLARHRFTVRHGKKRRSFQAPDAATFDAWLSALEKALEPKRDSEHVPTPSTTTSTATTATTSQGRSSNAGSNATNSVGRVSSAGSSAPRSTRRRASSAARAPALRLTLERPCFTRDPTNSKLIRLHRPAPTIAGDDSSNNSEAEMANAAGTDGDLAVNEEEVPENATIEGLQRQLEGASASDNESGVHADLNVLPIEVDQQAACFTAGSLSESADVEERAAVDDASADAVAASSANCRLAGEDAATFKQDDDGPVSAELAVEVSDELVAAPSDLDTNLGSAIAVTSTSCKSEDASSKVEAVIEAMVGVAPVVNEESSRRDSSAVEIAGVDAEVEATVGALVAAVIESANDSERDLGATTDTSTADIEEIEPEVTSVVEALVSAVIQAENETLVSVQVVATPSAPRSSKIVSKSSTRSASLVTKHKWVPLDPTNSRLLWVRCSVEAGVKSAPRSNPRRRATKPAKRWIPIEPNNTRLIWIRRVENAAARIESRYKATSSTRKWVPLDPANSRLFWVRRQVVPIGSPIVNSSSSRLYPFRHGKQRRHKPTRC